MKTWTTLLLLSLSMPPAFSSSEPAAALETSYEKLEDAFMEAMDPWHTGPSKLSPYSILSRKLFWARVYMDSTEVTPEGYREARLFLTHCIMQSNPNFEDTSFLYIGLHSNSTTRPEFRIERLLLFPFNDDHGDHKVFSAGRNIKIDNILEFSLNYETASSSVFFGNSIVTTNLYFSIKDETFYYSIDKDGARQGYCYFNVSKP